MKWISVGAAGNVDASTSSKVGTVGDDEMTVDLITSSIVKLGEIIESAWHSSDLVR
jgi:hypothetical protein